MHRNFHTHMFHTHLVRVEGDDLRNVAHFEPLFDYRVTTISVPLRCFRQIGWINLSRNTQFVCLILLSSAKWFALMTSRARLTQLGTLTKDSGLQGRSSFR